ncbi:MAG: ABC transporter substrate-binding protein [Clostridia bacterium]|nr:ABC transporter substrate-binding protein [Clostridia bacterium]
MKRLLTLILALLLILMTFGCGESAIDEVEEEEDAEGELVLFDNSDYDWQRFKDRDITINVFNWGEYIADGLNDMFTEITGIKVNYSNYDTNETMYAKLSGGGASYDVIVPSDYMIARLIREGLVQKLDFANIPNVKYNLDTLDSSFDPTEEYSVPYTWGLVGMVYNTNYVDADDIKSWSALWNTDKYSGKILMFNNPRDAFAIAHKKLGLSLNTHIKKEWDTAFDELVLQRSHLYSYVTDEIFNKMESGECWIAPCYAGDFITMYDMNEDLAFSYPEEGTNVFVDSMCVPVSSKNKEAAEMYINFMCDPNVACENINYIWYFTPNAETEQMEDYFANCDLDEVSDDVIATPEYLEKCEAFVALEPDTQKYMESLWLLLKKSDVGWGLYITVAAILVFSIGLYVFKRIKKAKESK